jgi:acetyltransferase-like isoleucine patch superfamily enzyme
MEQDPKPPIDLHKKDLTRKDLNSAKSERTGFAGFIENLMRKTQSFFHLGLMLPLYLTGAGIIAMALVPGLYFFEFIQKLTGEWSGLAHHLAMAFGLAAGFILYGFSMLVVAPIINKILRCELNAWRGPYYSLPAIRWYIHNSLTYIMRYTFLEFLTPSPANLLFYRLMGMRIGSGTIINSSAISDPSLITMGKKVTIGGSVTIVGHYGQGGFLVLAPVKIEDHATIGLKAIIMGGAEIGEGAKVLAGSVVLPKTKIPAGETWAGVPAVKINLSELKKAA